MHTHFSDWQAGDSTSFGWHATCVAGVEDGRDRRNGAEARDMHACLLREAESGVPGLSKYNLPWCRRFGQSVLKVTGVCTLGNVYSRGQVT